MYLEVYIEFEDNGPLE